MSFHHASNGLVSQATRSLAEHTEARGRQGQEGWQRLARKHGLDVTVRGWPALTTFSLDYPGKAQQLGTLLTQLMLERGYLATTTYYPTRSSPSCARRSSATTWRRACGERRRCPVSRG